MNEPKQIAGWTGPTPDTGYAAYVQVFAFAPYDRSCRKRLVMRGNDGELIEIDLEDEAATEIGVALMFGEDGY